MKKVSIEKELLSYIETIEKLSSEEMSRKLSGWLEKQLVDLVEEIKPSWVKLLIPVHAALLFGLWFIHLIDF